MPISINTNISSMSAMKNLGKNQKMLSTSFDRLSSGLRINTAADDAAGLAVSESMKSQIRSYTVAERNAADGVSMAQTAEGALGEVHSVLGRMRELSMQAANGTLSSSDRGQVSTEFTQLQAEITRIQGSAKYNGVAVIATAASSVTFQVGLNNGASDQINVSFGGLALATVVAGTTAVTTATGALNSLARIDAAINTVSTSRAGYGASMNRLDIATSSIQTMRLNLSAANSRITDVDVATESAALSRNQVLTQAGISVLGQANQLPQMAFGLIG